jgi:hypothetical protein
MAGNFGPPIHESNGYTAHEIFIKDEDGQLVSVGYGVFSPDGRLIAAFADLKDALDYLDEVSQPPPPGSCSGMGM